MPVALPVRSPFVHLDVTHPERPAYFQFRVEEVRARVEVMHARVYQFNGLAAFGHEAVGREQAVHPYEVEQFFHISHVLKLNQQR